MSSSTYLPSFTKVATGNVPPAVFVIADNTTARGAKIAGANAKAIGISQQGAMLPPNLIEALGGATTVNYAATAGNEFGVYGLGKITQFTVGAGGVTNGDEIETDASGFGVTSTVSGHNVVAIALETAPAGALCRGEVVFKTHG